MTTHSRSRAFSLTELLVIVAVILLLMSFLIVGTGGVHGQAVRVKCQHRLEQIGQGSVVFASKNHGQLPRSYDPVTGRRWYDALLAERIFQPLGMQHRVDIASLCPHHADAMNAYLDSLPS